MSSNQHQRGEWRERCPCCDTNLAPERDHNFINVRGLYQASRPCIQCIRSGRFEYARECSVTIVRRDEKEFIVDLMIGFNDENFYYYRYNVRTGEYHRTQ